MIHLKFAPWVNGFAPMKSFAPQKIKTGGENAQTPDIFVQGEHYKT
jgi:hypothetical protein